MSRALFEQAEAALKAHDWYYAMSDDFGVWTRGKASYDTIADLLRTMPRAVAQELWERYAPTRAKGGLFSDRVPFCLPDDESP